MQRKVRQMEATWDVPDEIPDDIVRTSMPKQVWMGSEEQGEPTEEKFDEVVNGHLPIKPQQGLWTSTYTPDYDTICDWDRWCSREGYLAGSIGYILEVQDEVRVLEVDDLEDLKVITRNYYDEDYYDIPIPMDYPIDFEQMAADGFDGLHLTEEGQKKTRMTGREEPDLYGWDSESTIWFSWVFTDVEKVGDVNKWKPYDER